MNDGIDARVASASPIDDREVAALPLTAVKAELMEQIMSAPVSEVALDVAVDVVPRPPSRGRRVVALGAAAAVAAAALVVAQSFQDDPPSPAWAQELVEIAEAAPRLLLVADGWEITRAHELSVGLGDMTYTGPEGRELDLRWGPSSTHTQRVADRIHGADLVRELDVLGNEATLTGRRALPPQPADQPPPPVDAAALADHPGIYSTVWRQDGYAIEVLGVSDRIDDHVALLASLRVVDVDAWLSAMPPSVLSRENVTSTAGELLDGIPLPDGFDPATIDLGGAVTDRYQVGAGVTGAIACAWIEQWLAATDAGDAAAAQEAVDALATSRGWPILVEMADQGGWSAAVWEYADAVAGDGTILGGRVLTVEESYEAALGCQG